MFASSGPWHQTGPLRNADPSILRTAMSANVDSHFYLYNALVNKTKGSYQLLNGGMQQLTTLNPNPPATAEKP